MADIRDTLQASLGSTLTIERELGGGGMSRVFVVDDTVLGRKVVIKVLPPEMAATFRSTGSGARYCSRRACNIRTSFRYCIPATPTDRRCASRTVAPPPRGSGAS